MDEATRIIREPKDLIGLVAGGVQPIEDVTAGSFTAKVGLGPTGNGYATLFWSTSGATPGKYDFVALYKSAADPDTDYQSGQWQWVNGEKDGSYQTGTGIGEGQEARYLIWNGSAYISIARTGSYKGTQWSA